MQIQDIKHSFKLKKQLHQEVSVFLCSFSENLKRASLVRLEDIKKNLNNLTFAYKNTDQTQTQFIANESQAFVSSKLTSNFNKFCNLPFINCFSKPTSTFVKLALFCGFIGYGLSNFSYAQEMILENGSNKLIDNPEASPNLDKERQLLAHHDRLAKQINDNYNKILIRKQPANKTEPCLVGTDSMNRYLTGNVLVFWEGNCANGLADGFGRVYVINGKRKIFELLANFHAEDPNFTTEYFSKDTQTANQTSFFYGKANRYRSSGINIIKNDLDNDLLVALETIDKVNWITFLKETSKNSGYILNVKDLMNHRYFIHDLQNTPYKSMTMSYKLTNNDTGYNDSYSFFILSDGSTKTELNDGNNRSTEAPLPKDVVEYALELNEEIEVSIEDSIKNVIESMPVVNAYLNVICNPEYDNPVCRKMQCKNMCNLTTNITPDNEEVKQLLLRLVEHHNLRPLNSSLASVIKNIGSQDMLTEAPNRKEMINSSLPNLHLDRASDNFAPVDFSGKEYGSLQLNENPPLE